MTSRAITLPLFPLAPYGLNKQERSSLLGPEWASELINFVFDEDGTLTSRMGTVNINNSGAGSIGGSGVQTLFIYVDSSGTQLIIGSTGPSSSDIFKSVIGGAISSIKGTVTAPTAGNWQFTNFNGKCVGFQASHAPIVLTSVSGSFANISLTGSTQPTTSANTILAAFGRLWTIDGVNLKYSDLLDEAAWNSSYSLKEYWGDGGDVGVALAEFNGHLVVFGRNHIVIYNASGGPDDLVKVESIGGVGCIARDSVQQVGDDLWFLSSSGVQSLGRVIQEKSMPRSDISKNVRDYLLSSVNYSALNNIKSTYNEYLGLYILNTSGAKVFVFDTRFQLPDGTYRVTEWGHTNTSYYWRGMVSSYSGQLYVGRAAGASVCLYSASGRDDIEFGGSSGGQHFACDFRTPWLNLSHLDPSLTNKLKILKNLSFKIYSEDVFDDGGVDQDLYDIYWYTDFNETANSSRSFISTDDEQGSLMSYKVPISGSGQYFQMRFSASSFFEMFKLYDFNVQLKIGKDVV